MYAELVLTIKDDIEVDRIRDKPITVAADHTRKLGMTTVGPREEFQRAFEDTVGGTIMTLLNRAFEEFYQKAEEAVTAYKKEQEKKAKKKPKNQPADKKKVDEKPADAKKVDEKPADAKKVDEKPADDSGGEKGQ